VKVFAVSKQIRNPLIVEAKSKSVSVLSTRSRFESILQTIESSMKHLDVIGSKQAKIRVQCVLVKVTQITRKIIAQCPTADSSKPDKMLMAQVETQTDSIISFLDAELDRIRNQRSPYHGYRDCDIIFTTLLHPLYVQFYPKARSASPVKGSTWKGHALRLEQDLLHAHGTVGFMEWLSAIDRLRFNHVWEYFLPKVFITYTCCAFNKPHEKWTSGYVVRFAEDLRQAGFTVNMREASEFGRNQAKHAREGIGESNYIIVMCTESLLAKQKAEVKSVCNELILIDDKCKAALKSSKSKSFAKHYNPVIPIVLSGSMESAVPVSLRRYAQVVDTRKSYLVQMCTLIIHLCRAPKQDARLMQLMQGFLVKYASLLVLAKGLPKSCVEAHLRGEKHIERREEQVQETAADALLQSLLSGVPSDVACSDDIKFSHVDTMHGKNDAKKVIHDKSDGSGRQSHLKSGVLLSKRSWSWSKSQILSVVVLLIAIMVAVGLMFTLN